MRFMQTESVLQTKNRSGPAKNRFSVALGVIFDLCRTLRCSFPAERLAGKKTARKC